MGAGTNWSKLSVGSSNAAAIDTSGRLYTWGENINAQLGICDQITRSSPVQVSGSWTLISNSTTPQGFGPWAFGLKTDGTLWAWGNNDYGQYGNFTRTFSNIPTQILGTWITAAAGWINGYAIRDDYTLWGWGSNSNGELGQNVIVPTARSSPVQIATANIFRSLSISAFSMFAIKLDGTILAWGPDNGRGALGLGTTIARSSPTQVGTLSWSAIAASLSTTTGISAGQTPGPIGPLNNLYGWGLNISNGTSIFRSSPVQINSITPYSTALAGAALIGSSSWIAVAAGSSHSLGITSLGQMFAWGDNSFGKLGYAPAGTPISTPNSNGSSYIINETNTLYTWGYNSSGGQMGDNTTINKSGPINITNITGIKFKNIAQAKSSTNGFTLAIDDENSLWAWGANTAGQLGDKTTINRSTPVQISKTSWNQIAVGLSHSLGIKNDGTLWGWGLNTNGQAGFLSWKAIASGIVHSLAIASDNSLWAWGQGTGGALGDPTTVANKSSPFRIFASSSTSDTVSFFSAVAAGDRHSAAIDTLGRLWMWGFNTSGQLGNSTTVSRSSPVQVGTSSWTSVSVGFNHTLAIRVDGTLWAWGLNSAGQLGIGLTTNRSSPVQLGSASDWSRVFGGGSTAMAISAFRLYIWGLNSTGQLGLNDVVSRSSPVQLGTGSWVAVAAGSSHTMAIDIIGNLFSWGNNSAGKLGLNDTISRSSPVQIGTSSWTAIAANGDYTAGILLGLVYTWGSGTSGKLGLNDIVSRSNPTQVGSSLWTQISCQFDTAFAITNDGTGNLYGWGSGGAGALGNGASTVNRSSPVQIGNAILIASRSSPAQIGTDTNWSVVTAIDSASFAIKTTGTLYSWGLNTEGRLGLNDTITRSSPTQIGSNNTWSSLAPGRAFVLARTSTNTIFAFGRNNEGQLGIAPLTYGWQTLATGAILRNNGSLYTWAQAAAGAGQNTADSIIRSVPTQLGTSSWTAVGNQSGIALRVDGTIWAWYQNIYGGFYGQAGQGDTIARSSPVQVGAATNWSSVQSSRFTRFAINNLGQLWGWGYNQYGHLGINSTVDRSSPVQVPGSWSMVYASDYNTAGIKTDGTLWTWGDSYEGVLGINSVVMCSSPVQVAGTWSTVVISGGNNAISLAIKTNGTLWAWGSNDQGQLGQNDTINRSSPVQIPGSWTTMATDNLSCAGIKNDGTLWSWGRDYAGDMGQNTNGVARSSPIQVGNSSWNFIYGSDYTFTFSGRLTNGVIYAWGAQDLDPYVLGDGTSINKSSPVQISTTLSPLTFGDTLNRSSPTQVGTGFIDIEAGESHSIALDTSGNVWTWGKNASGQLGLNDTVDRSSPVQVTALPASISSISGGSVSSYAIKGNTLYAWGGGAQGQLGDNSATDKSSPVVAGYLWYNSTNFTTSSSPVQIGSDSSWTQVSASVSNSLAITTAGTLFSWGDNAIGQAGLNNIANRSSPTQITSSVTTDQFASIAAGGSGGFAIRATPVSNAGVIAGWGVGTFVAGASPTVNRSSPVQVYTGSMGVTPLVPFKISTTSSWTQIQTSITGATAIDSTGLTYTWGDNYPYGYLGNFAISGIVSSPVVLGNINRPYFYSPAVVDSSNSYTSISAGYSHALAIRSDGTLWSWGGPGARLTPSTASWDKIIAGNVAFWAIRTDSTLWAWGRNDGATTPLGLSDTINRSSPVQIGSDAYTDIATGESHVVAVKSNGTLWTWGGNDNGQLGLNDTINRSFPTQVGTDTNWSKVATGNSHTLVIKTNGTLWSYGSNTYGQLGSNITTNRSSPVQVGTSSWSFINAGGGGGTLTNSQASLAIDINGYLYTWGGYYLGADMYDAPLPAYRSVPVQIGTEKYLKAVSLAGFYTAAIRTDGTLWWAGWRDLSGVGSLVNRSSPTQVGTDLWSDINVGGANVASLLGAAIARRQDGTLWVWGTDTTGRLGQGNLGNITSMVQVTGTGGSLSQFAFGKVGAFTTNTGLFLDMYGRMYISGSSGSGEGGGQRADNITSPTLFTITPINTPTQIVSGSWSTVSAGLDVTLAKNSSGTLYGWGLNTSYQTGIGTGPQYVTSPVVVGSSTSSVSVGGTTGGYVKLR
jgi:alpha-tubulin suppressor-like RCC1 family protein